MRGTVTLSINTMHNVICQRRSTLYGRPLAAIISALRERGYSRYPPLTYDAP